MSSELFSHRLLRYREAHGLTQVEMARALGITPRYVISLENGQKELDPNSSLARLFVAMEEGSIAAPPESRGPGMREDAALYRYEERTSVPSGLTSQDALAQVRADLAMIEGGAISEKRRAYHFLTQVHLPLLAKVMKITP